jgi:AraC family transcriptional regulator
MTGGQERYRARLERVAQHIAEALEDGRTPTIEELADVAALSPFHFHRIYRLLTGEGVAQSLQRLKVAHALERVGAGENVTTAALAAGYGSSQNLARAVRQRAGASVSELRSAGRLAGTVSELRLPQSREGTMAIEFVDHSPVRIACRLATGPYDELNLAYRALFEDLSRLVGPEGVTEVYGIPIDDPRDVAPAEHRFICAMSVDDAHKLDADQVETRDIGGGRYARLRHQGPYSEIPAALDALYAQLIDGGHDPADRETFIHYVDQPSAADGPDAPHISDIYVPVG